MHACASVSMCECRCGFPQRPEEDVGSSPGVGVTGNYELFKMIAGNKTSFLLQEQYVF